MCNGYVGKTQAGGLVTQQLPKVGARKPGLRR